MTRVIGTAGHIDHGKTTLLRALTGIDADRLPEERRRGLTIDVGYAHLVTASGDAARLRRRARPRPARRQHARRGRARSMRCLLVVAADDGPRAQTLEHLALLDALALREGVAVVTKADLADADRVAEVEAAVRDQLDATTLRDIPVLAVSATSGVGLDRLASELASIAARPAGPRAHRRPGAPGDRPGVQHPRSRGGRDRLRSRRTDRAGAAPSRPARQRRGARPRDGGARRAGRPRPVRRSGGAPRRRGRRGIGSGAGSSSSHPKERSARSTRSPRGGSSSRCRHRRQRRETMARVSGPRSVTSRHVSTSGRTRPTRSSSVAGGT